MPVPIHVTFRAGPKGRWKIDRTSAVVGESLPAAAPLEVLEATTVTPAQTADWVLRGVTSNVRYTQRAELKRLESSQEGLERSRATCAALIPIRKNEAWWSLAQEERRAIFEEQSRHIAIGLEYLPAVARRLRNTGQLRRRERCHPNAPPEGVKI
jgi:chlorite dismutase